MTATFSSSGCRVSTLWLKQFLRQHMRWRFKMLASLTDRQLVSWLVIFSLGALGRSFRRTLNFLFHVVRGQHSQT